MTTITTASTPALTSTGPFPFCSLLSQAIHHPLLVHPRRCLPPSSVDNTHSPPKRAPANLNTKPLPEKRTPSRRLCRLFFFGLPHLGTLLFLFPSALRIIIIFRPPPSVLRLLHPDHHTKAARQLHNIRRCCCFWVPLPTSNSSPRPFSSPPPKAFAIRRFLLLRSPQI